MTHVFGVTSCREVRCQVDVNCLAGALIDTSQVPWLRGTVPDLGQATDSPQQPCGCAHPLTREARVAGIFRPASHEHTVTLQDGPQGTYRHDQLCEMKCEHVRALQAADLLLVSSSGFALLVPPPTRPLMRIAGTEEHGEEHLSVDSHGSARHWYNAVTPACRHHTCQACHPPRLYHVASRTSDLITQRSNRKTALCCCARSTTTCEPWGGGAV